MKALFLAAAMGMAAMAVPQAAQAAGCLKGAAVGGLGGHMVGHGVLGAAAGCAVGRHHANRSAREQSNMNQTSGTTTDSSGRATTN